MGKQYEIYQRIFQFVVRGLQVPQYFPKSVEAKIITDQYVRALTSVGANDNEADGSITKKDFIHCCTIVRKELKEVHYWLRIIAECFPRLEPRLHLLIEENQELIKIISTIISKTVKNTT